MVVTLNCFSMALDFFWLLRHGALPSLRDAGPKPRALVLVLQFCSAYPHFHSNGSATKREHSPQPSRVCCKSLAVAGS
jgi:hypothetical protein